MGFATIFSRRSGTALMMALAANAAMAAGPNLVTNGSFNDLLSGWTELADNTHSGANYQNRYLDNPSPDGGFNFGVQNFRGKYAGPDNGRGLYQDISGLVVGDTYQLTFYQTGSDFIWSGEGEYWEVQFGSQTKDGATWKVEPGNDNYLYNGNWNRTSADGDSINANFRWTKSTLTFVASSETQRLTFRERQTDETRDNWDTSVTPYGTPSILMLDGVSLNNISAVPEASTTSMVLAGFGVLGLVVTRRRRTQR